MRNTQEQVYNTGRRIQRFLDANDSTFPSINKSGVRAELDALVTQLGAAAGDQAGARLIALGETAKQRTLRLALRLNHMKPIASVAKLKLRSVPNFAAFKMPDPNVRVAGLVAHAQGMTGAAKEYGQVFLDAGLPTDFLAGLTAAAEAVRQSIDTRAKALGRKVNATGSLKQLATQGRSVFTALNDFVVPILSADAAHSGLLAEWKTARRITLRAGPKIGAEQEARTLGTPPQSPTPPAAVTPTTPPTPVVAESVGAQPVAAKAGRNIASG